jgi:hypothetical protein
LSVVVAAPELDAALAAGLGEALAAKTLAAPRTVSIPATVSAARAAFMRDGDRAVTWISGSGCVAVGSIL